MTRLPRNLEHFFKFDWHFVVPRFRCLVDDGFQANVSQVQNFHRCNCRRKDYPCHTNCFVDAHFSSNRSPPFSWIETDIMHCNSSTMAGQDIHAGGKLRRGTNRHRRFDKLFVPALENEQRPNLLLYRNLVFLLQTYNLLNGLRIEELAAGGITRQQRIAHEVAKLESEPRFNGYRKPLLGPVEDRMW